MDTHRRNRGITPFCGVVAVLFAISALHAEEALGPMATGGVMRDAERRALAPAPEKDAATAPEIAPAKQSDAAPASPEEARALGAVESVEVLGSTEFAEREGIAAAIASALGGEGERTLGDVKKALGDVQQSLIAKGYYLARILPASEKPYDAEAKTLYIVMDEGVFGKINIAFERDEEDESEEEEGEAADGEAEGEAKSGGRWFSEEQIRKRFKELSEGSAFDYGKLRTALFEANSHPDLTIDTSIGVSKALAGEGREKRVVRAADIDLSVRESFPLHMVWEINNYGMEEVEEWQTSLTVQYLNLTKHDDVLTLSPAMSFGGELFSLAASYMLPHEWWLGGATTLYGGYSRLDVDDVVPRLDLEGSGWFVGLQHSENLYDTDRHLLALSAGILWRYTEDQYKAYGKYKLNERGASILPLSLALSYTGKKADALGGRNFATVQGVFNVMSAGDDLDEMWTDADEHYWILRWQLARLQPLFGFRDDATDQSLHQWTLFLKLEGQYTTDNLIPVEKLSMGGYNCMRGYHARGYLGDYGVYGTSELRTPILVDALASVFGDRTGRTPIDRLQFLGFIDYGWTAFNDLPSGYDEDEFIWSAGLGVRMSVTKYTQLKCDLAFPLRDTDWADDDDVELYFSVQVQF